MTARRETKRSGFTQVPTRGGGRRFVSINNRSRTEVLGEIVREEMQSLQHHRLAETAMLLLADVDRSDARLAGDFDAIATEDDKKRLRQHLHEAPNTLTVKAADPSKPVLKPTGALVRRRDATGVDLDQITTEPVEVPNDSFYRKRLRMGDLVEVDTRRERPLSSKIVSELFAIFEVLAALRARMQSFTTQLGATRNSTGRIGHDSSVLIAIVDELENAGEIDPGSSDNKKADVLASVAWPGLEGPELKQRIQQLRDILRKPKKQARSRQVRGTK